MNQQSDSEWYLIKDINNIDSPAFIVYPERVKTNIKNAIKIAGDVNRLLPHIKTHKTKEAVLLMLEEGIYKFKCATIAEAEMLALCKAKEVLLAYQPVGPKLNRFIDLIKCYRETKFSCLIDNAAIAAELSQLAVAHHLHVTVYLDLNVGMNRTGAAPNKAFALYAYCADLPGIQPTGLHVYDGHIHHPLIEYRKKDCDDSFIQIEKLKQQIVQKGFAEPIVIAGGSPTFPVHCQRENVVCSPGTFIYWDINYQKSCPELPFLIAALVITRVVSVLGSSKICVDLGHKSIASENDLHHRVFFLNAPDLKMISHSEEHLVMEAGNGHSYRPGDVLYGVPFHVCPTAALYEKAITIENKGVKGEWKTIARNRKINY